MQHFNFSKSTLYNSHHYILVLSAILISAIPVIALNPLHFPLKCFFQYSFWTNSYNPIPLCSDMQTEILLRLDFSVFKLKKMAVHLRKEKMSTRHGHCWEVSSISTKKPRNSKQMIASVQIQHFSSVCQRIPSRLLPQFRVKSGNGEQFVQAIQRWRENQWTLHIWAGSGFEFHVM